MCKEIVVEAQKWVNSISVKFGESFLRTIGALDLKKKKKPSPSPMIPATLRFGVKIWEFQTDQVDIV